MIYFYGFCFTIEFTNRNMTIPKWGDEDEPVKKLSIIIVDLSGN